MYRSELQHFSDEEQLDGTVHAAGNVLFVLHAQQAVI